MRTGRTARAEQANVEVCVLTLFKENIEKVPERLSTNIPSALPSQQPANVRGQSSPGLSLSKLYFSAKEGSQYFQ